MTTWEDAAVMLMARHAMAAQAAKQFLRKFKKRIFMKIGRSQAQFIHATTFTFILVQSHPHPDRHFLCLPHFLFLLLTQDSFQLRLGFRHQFLRVTFAEIFRRFLSPSSLNISTNRLSSALPCRSSIAIGRSRSHVAHAVENGQDLIPQSDTIC
jgi:hypothetical protein